MTLNTLLRDLSQIQSLSDLDTLLCDHTLKGILNSWLLECQQNNYSPRTIEHYRKKVSAFLHFLGETITEPAQVKPQYITLFLLEYRKNHKPSGEHGFYRAIHTYFAYMKEKHIIEHHPMEGMKPPRVPKVVIIPYSEDQIKTMIKVNDLNYLYFHNFTSVRNKAILLIYLSSGLRRLEMSEIKLGDVNIRTRTIKVMGKGSKERVVGFGTGALKALLEYFKLRRERVKDQNCPYLWLSEEGTQLGYWGVGLAIHDLRVRANIKVQSSTHALRHAFATQSLRNGARREDVQLLMGHSTPAMTQRYQATITSEDAVKQHPAFDPVDHWKLQ